MKSTIKLAFSLFICAVSGILGLGLVFVMDPGWEPVALGVGFYALLAGVLTLWHRGRYVAIWAIAPGWGLLFLGLMGAWISYQDPPSADWGYALLFLLGPSVSGFVGGAIALALGRR